MAAHSRELMPGEDSFPLGMWTCVNLLVRFSHGFLWNWDSPNFGGSKWDDPMDVGWGGRSTISGHPKMVLVYPTWIPLYVVYGSISMISLMCIFMLWYIVCIHHIPIISPVYVIHVFIPHCKRSDSWLIVSNIPITCYIYILYAFDVIYRVVSPLYVIHHTYILFHIISYTYYIYIPLYIYIYTHHIPHDIPVISPPPGRKAPCEPWDRWASERTVPGPKFLCAPCWWPGWDKNWLVATGTSNK